MNAGDITPFLREIARSLRILIKISSNSRSTVSSKTTGDIPEGYKYIKIIKTNDSGTVVITLSDEDTYTLTTSGSSFELPSGGKLPEITITATAGGTWRWIGTK